MSGSVYGILVSINLWGYSFMYPWWAFKADYMKVQFCSFFSVLYFCSDSPAFLYKSGVQLYLPIFQGQTDWIFVSSVDYLGEKQTWTMLSSQIHEHNLFFHLLRSLSPALWFFNIHGTDFTYHAYNEVFYFEIEGYNKPYWCTGSYHCSF